MRVYQFRHIRAERHSSRGTVTREVLARPRYRVTDQLTPCADPDPRSSSVAVLTRATSLSARRAAATAPAPEHRLHRGRRHARLSLRSLASGRRACTERLPRTKAGLNLPSLASSRYLERLASAPDALSRRIEASDPRRERALALSHRGQRCSPSRSRAARSPAWRALPGVVRVYRRPTAIARWTAACPQRLGRSAHPISGRPTSRNAGQGIKIGIIDDGIDQAHPYFDPTGYTMPAGYPKGDTAYTTAKVIVARAFAPPGLELRERSLPFDPRVLDHGTTSPESRPETPERWRLQRYGRTLSGVAPRAYLGNYKASDDPDRAVRTGRELAGDRCRHRGGRLGRDERDQPLARRARDRSSQRHRQQSGERSPAPRVWSSSSRPGTSTTRTERAPSARPVARPARSRSPPPRARAPRRARSGWRHSRRRSDAVRPPAQAERQCAGHRRSFLRLGKRRHLGCGERHQRGFSACGRCGRSVTPTPSRLDRFTNQVGLDLDRHARHRLARSRAFTPAGRRGANLTSSGEPTARLHVAFVNRVCFRPARSERDTKRHCERCRRGCRILPVADKTLRNNIRRFPKGSRVGDGPGHLRQSSRT